MPGSPAMTTGIGRPTRAWASASVTVARSFTRPTKHSRTHVPSAGVGRQPRPGHASHRDLRRPARCMSALRFDERGEHKVIVLANIDMIDVDALASLLAMNT